MARRSFRRGFRWFLWGCATLIVLAGLFLGGLYLRLQQGPLAFAGLSDRVISALSGYFASDLKMSLDDSALELNNGSFALRIHGLRMVNPERQVQLLAPDTVVSVDTWSLAFGRLHPRMIEFIDLQVVGNVNEDGSITFAPEDAPRTADAPPKQDAAEAISATTADKRQSRLSRGVATFLNMVAGTDGPLGTLDRAQLTNLRLTLIDAKRNISTQFSRIDVRFERTAVGGRTFAARFNGHQGPWSVEGEVTPQDNGFQTAFSVIDAPVQDVLVLSGLSGVPMTTSLELSGKANLTLRDGLLTRFEGSFGTGKGRVDIHDRDATQLLVDSSQVDLNWDEAARRMQIAKLEFFAGETHFLMAGNVVLPPGKPWQMQLAADHAIFSGVAEGDKPVPVDRFEGELNGSDGVMHGHLMFRGPALDAEIGVQIGDGADSRAVAVDAQVNGTSARSVLRLWPEITASAPRRYLVGALKGGTVESGFVKVRMGGDLVRDAMKGGALPDDALLVDVDLVNADLVPTPGLPSIAKMPVSVHVTGRSATVSGRNAVVAMPNGRSLKLPAISFELKDFWPKDTVGKIAADIEGGADALVSYLRLPKIHDTIKWNINPDDIKGKAALKLTIDLPVRNIPAFADLPVSVTGHLSDVTLIDIAGTEKLEKGTFTIDYDRGSLALKGDGQLANAPASITINQRVGGEGSAVFLFSLDEAARARKGMNFGSQLTGTLPLKVTMALGKGSGDHYLVEADLAKVAINNLLPGWSKALGRPGKLSLTATKVESGTDIKNVNLESGSVRLAGQAHLNKDSAFVNAELTSFQLAQGDDMQAKIDKTGDIYRASIRGNLGDARPIIRSFTDVSGSSQRNGHSGSALNIDIDANINILTGFNDESLTKTTLKASIRNNALRQMVLAGRLGSAEVTAQTGPKNGVQTLVVHADNAGSFLRFLDVYRRMTGGDIFIETGLGEGAQNGYAMARNFVIRNEPALRRIVPTQTQGSGRQRIDVNDAPFTKARVDFTRSGGRLDFHDAAIWGTHVGFTLDGYLDFQRSRLDVAGTFVPAYGLNNVFAQVPLFGEILGGSRYGGLFGVNFRLTGPISSPDTTVNPLSAVAPGIFRKLFGAGGPGTEAASQNQTQQR